MTEMTVLNGVAIEELLTIPMAVEAVEQAYLEKSKGDAALWPMVFHEFDPGHADLDIKSGDLGGLGFYGLKVVSWFGANPGKGLPALYGTSPAVRSGHRRAQGAAERRPHHRLPHRRGGGDRRKVSGAA